MSAPPWANKVKVCVRCRRDCSGVARLKNPQGQYMCRECFDAEALGLKRPAAGGVAAEAGGANGAAKEQGGANGAGMEPVEAGSGGGELDQSIPVEEIVNSGEGLGRHAHAGVDGARDPKMCGFCGMILKDSAIICTSCGMNSTTGLFLNGKPAAAAHNCVKCGYDMRGLKSPRCPECGEINTREKRLKHRPRQQVLRDDYLRPALYWVVGFGVAMGIGALMSGVPGVTRFLLAHAIGCVATAIGYGACAIFWVGFEAPLPVIAVRLAGCVALAQGAAALVSPVRFGLGLGVLASVGMMYAMLMDLFDHDGQDSALITLVISVCYIGLSLLAWVYL